MTAENKTTKFKPTKTENKKTMIELLSSQDSDNLRPVKVGQLIEGKITEIGRHAVYLDLGPKGVGVIWKKEFRNKPKDEFKVGDKITATVVELENEDGYLELSFQEAREKKAWEDLKKKMQDKEVISAKIMDANRGGLMTEISGIVGFLPVSQLSSEHYPRVEEGDKNKILSELKKFVGQNLKVKVIDLNPAEEKLIVSEKSAMKEDQKKRIDKWKVGDVIEGEITGVADFGAFVKFDEPPVEGLIHISELAWQLIEDPKDIVKVGDKIKAKIISLDDERISLSIKALQKDPWAEGIKKYKKGQVVKGKVTKITPFGAFVQLDKDIHGLAHTSELEEKKDVLKVDQSYDFEILSIEPEEHRLALALVKKSEKVKK